MRSLRRIIALITVIFCLNAWANTSFVVHDIRIIGLHRIQMGTVLNYLPVHEGQTVTYAQSKSIIETLYQTGFFSNVRLAREGNALLIYVTERPVISDISISGNKILKTKQLVQILKEQGIQEGKVFDRATLTNVTRALEQQYYNLGHYNAHIVTQVTPQIRDRVGVAISIYEGRVAKIKEIKIIGNHAYKDKKLLGLFRLKRHRIWSFIGHSDQYSREKLNADIESLRSYYMNRGYLNFTVTSTQVSILPDRSWVHVVIHIEEGPVYHVSGFKITGETLGLREHLHALVRLKPGERFARDKIIAIDNVLTNALGDRGYAFASIRAIPQVDEVNHRVFVNFVIHPKRKTYVNTISFTGNTRTGDSVLRREMRQEEGGVYSLSDINESKRRLANLGYLTNVKVKTKPVVGHPERVDLGYSVKESSSATASLQAGYSDRNGLILGASLHEGNFLGTGKAISLAVNHSDYMQSYSFSYTNPYYTLDGISRSLSLFYHRTTPGNVSGLTSYTSDDYGASVNYSVPISEFDTFAFGYGFDHIHLRTGSTPPFIIAKFLAKHGTTYDQTLLTAGWQHSDLDRAIFPTRGLSQWLGASIGVPIFNHSLDFYKIDYSLVYYHPIVKKYILKLYTQLGYGDGYNDMSTLPFFKNYYAGGIKSVPGYVSNTLGPKDASGDAVGGKIMLVGGIHLIVPNPFQNRLRTSIFVAAGNVYDNRVDLGQLRYSAGLAATWWSPMGPLQFSIADAINPHGDDVRGFQFSVGTAL